MTRLGHHVWGLVQPSSRNLTGAEFKVAVLLFSLPTTGENEVCLSIQTLANGSGLSWRGCHQAIHSLNSKGLIEICSSNKERTRVRFPACPPLEAPAGSPDVGVAQASPARDVRPAEIRLPALSELYSQVTGVPLTDTKQAQLTNFARGNEELLRKCLRILVERGSRYDQYTIEYVIRHQMRHF